MTQVSACHYCGVTDEPLTRDHVIPRSKGGPDAQWNAVDACEPCNGLKADMWPTCPCDTCDAIRDRFDEYTAWRNTPAPKPPPLTQTLADLLRVYA